MSHTKRRVQRVAWPYLLIDDDRSTILCEMTGAQSNPEAAGDARRLMALWNAAEELGLTTEAIEGGVIQGLYRTVYPAD